MDDFLELCTLFRYRALAITCNQVLMCAAMHRVREADWTA
jgi:hypothetical protein